MLPKMKMSRIAITTSTRNWLAKSTLLAGAVAGVIACEEPKEIGLSPTTPVGVVYTDTITVQRSTVLMPSTRSDTASNLLLGGYTDPTFGKVEAMAFTQLAVGITTQQGLITFEAKDDKGAVIPDDQLVYDSTRLNVRLSYFYGDTLQTQELRAYRLTEPLSATANYDINSTAAYESEPLARLSITPRPTTVAAYRLPVADAFGRELLSFVNKDAGKTTAAFQEKVRGLALTTQSGDKAAVLGLDALTPGNTGIVVYYHKAGDSTARAHFFPVGGARFNQIKADRSGTPLANLGPQQSLPASAINGQSFVQAATGVTTKLQFPGLDNLARNRRIAINRADLIITPKAPSNRQYYLPFYMTLGEVNEQNQLLRTPTNQFLYLIQPPQSLFDRTETSWFNPQVATINNGTYTFSLGGYLQSVASGLTPNNGLVVLTPGSDALSPITSQGALTFAQKYYLNNQITQAILEGAASVKLIVFYTSS